MQLHRRHTEYDGHSKGRSTTCSFQLPLGRHKAPPTLSALAPPDQALVGPSIIPGGTFSLTGGVNDFSEENQVKNKK